MNVKRLATTILGLMGIGCAATIVQWQPPPVPRGWFSGVGSGASCEEAQTLALKGLCESLFVQVSGTTTVRQQQQLTNAIGPSVRFSQVVDIVARTRTHCTFEGRPYRVFRKITADGRCHIQLTMSGEDFGRYLHSRTVVVRLRGDTNLLNPGDAENIRTAIYRYLGRKGLLILRNQTAHAVRSGDVVLHFQQRRSLTGMYAARLVVDIRVTKGGAVDMTRTLRTDLHYGASPAMAIAACVHELLGKLNNEGTR